MRVLFGKRKRSRVADKTLHVSKQTHLNQKPNKVVATLDVRSRETFGLEKQLFKGHPRTASAAFTHRTSLIRKLEHVPNADDLCFASVFWFDSEKFNLQIFTGRMDGHGCRFATQHGSTPHEEVCFSRNEGEMKIGDS